MSFDEKAFRERRENRKYMRAYEGDGCKVLEVESARVRYKGKKWHELDSFGKRKFENLLVIEEAPQPVKIRYI